MAKQLHNDAYLKLGFTELDGKPKCVVCFKVLCAESLIQIVCVDKPVEFFERKLKSIQGQRNVMTAFTTKIN